MIKSNNQKNISIQYYAILREESGKSIELLKTQANNTNELYEELYKKYDFSINCKQLKVAINGEFADWQTELKDGDEIILIPPVSGG